MSLATNPNASDANLDGIDNDCDGSVDEDAAAGDGDGDGYDESQGDCADDNAAIHPGATEVYYDGVDQNCDGMSDFDQDGDGSDSANFGGSDCNDLNPSLEALDLDGDGVTTCDGDCDDNDASVTSGCN